jgi:hypothetical protein
MKKFKNFNEFFVSIAKVHNPKSFIVVEESNKFYIKVNTLYGSINESFHFISYTNLKNFKLNDVIMINSILYKLGSEEVSTYSDYSCLEVL